MAKRKAGAVKPRRSNVDGNVAAEIRAKAAENKQNAAARKAEFLREFGPIIEQHARQQKRIDELLNAVEATYLARLAENGLTDDPQKSISVSSPGFIPAGDPRQQIYDEALAEYQDNYRAVLDLLDAEFSAPATPAKKRGAWARNELWKSWASEGLSVPDIRDRWNAMPEADRQPYKPYHATINNGKPGWDKVRKGIATAAKTAGTVAESC
jgi:hypothetical protein